MNPIFHLRPLEALHESWRHSSPELHLAVGGAGFGGWLAHIEWAPVLWFTSTCLTMFGGAAIQLWLQWRIAKIKIREAELNALQKPLMFQPDGRPDRQAGGLRPFSPE